MDYARLQQILTLKLIGLSLADIPPTVGIIGLETALSLGLAAVAAGCLSLPVLVRAMATRPAEIIGEGRSLKTFEGVVAAVNEIEPQFEALDDTALRAKTDEFRQRLRDGGARGHDRQDAPAVRNQAPGILLCPRVEDQHVAVT